MASDQWFWAVRNRRRQRPCAWLDELIEAARVEGASWGQIYRRVTMPLVGLVTATAAILKFLTMHNQYLWPLMVGRRDNSRPVIVGQQYFFQVNRAWGEIIAYLSLITTPVRT